MDLTELAYRACELREEGRSIKNVAQVLGVSTSIVQKLTTRVITYATSEEAAILHELVKRDKNANTISKFTLLAWRDRIDHEKLEKKESVYTTDYRKEFLDKYKRVFHK